MFENNIFTAKIKFPTGRNHFCEEIFVLNQQLAAFLPWRLREEGEEISNLSSPLSLCAVL